MTVRDLLSLILEEAKIWTYAGHTQLFSLFPELLLNQDNAGPAGRQSLAV